MARGGESVPDGNPHPPAPRVRSYTANRRRTLRATPHLPNSCRAAVVIPPGILLPH